MTGEEYLAQQKERFKHSKLMSYIDGTLASLLEAEERGCLFHGSWHTNEIGRLELHKTALDARKVIFAGKPWAAVSFTAEWTDDDFEQGTINGQPYMTARRSAIRDLYRKGGFLYQLSPATFHHTFRLTNYEFISYESAKPLKAVFIPDPYSLLLELNVKIKDRPNSGHILKQWSQW